MMPQSETTATATPAPTAVPTPIPTAIATPTTTPLLKATPVPQSTPTPWTALPTIASSDIEQEIFLDDLMSYSSLQRQASLRARMIRALPWIKDGLRLSDMRCAEGLVNLALEGGDLFFDLIDEPWVMEGRHQPAMESLGRLANWYPAEFQTVAAHPVITDGISDAEARIAATLWGVAQYNPELIDTLLDPDRVELEEREIDLHHTGRVRLTIIRTKPGAAVSMDLTETAVRTVEGFMSLPLSQRKVIVLCADATKGDFGSQNFWTHIGHATWNGTEHFSVGRIPHYAHEVGHYYFRGSDPAWYWATEGAASLLQAIQTNSYSGAPIRPEKPPCAHARDIAELESRTAGY